MEKQKKPIYKKWWFWVIIILVIGAIGSSMGDESQTVDKQKGETKETKQVEEKPTEEESEEKTEELYTIGDSFETGKLGVKIIEVEEKTEFISDNMFIDDIVTEGKFIVVTAELTNNDSEAKTFTNSQFTLIDDQEREFDTYTGSGLMTILGDNYLFLESCNPGMSRTGSFVFEVPTDVEAYSILVREKAFGGKKETVKLK